MKKILIIAVIPLMLAAAVLTSGCVSEYNQTTGTTTTIESNATGETSTTLCQSLYWFDSEHKECGYKKFCGTYMYLGLQTFETLDECETVLNNSLSTNYIIITSAPAQVNVNNSFSVSWYINTSPSKITHTSIRYGTESLPNPVLPSDYPESSAVLCTGTNCNVPGPFSIQMVLENPGTYYFRAYALVNGINLWSAEHNITVSTPTIPVTRNINLEADDYGFYMNGSSSSSLTVNRNDLVNITITLRTENTYGGGLDFRGCGESVYAMPGQSTVVSFVAKSNCAISSYWPGTGILKSSITIVVI